MDFLTILKKPVITEKTTRLRESNQYVVEVDPRSTKGDIKMAIEKLFKVDVLRVRTIKVPPKQRRKMGPVAGFTTVRKKAVVRLKQGQQITWDESAK